MSQPPSPERQVYGLRCVRCGNDLELPEDPRAVHIDCSYCGKDNILPDGLINARQRQNEPVVVERVVVERAPAIQHPTREPLLVEQTFDPWSDQRRQNRTGLIAFFALCGLFLVLTGMCTFWGQREKSAQEEKRARSNDPTLNGFEAVSARWKSLQTRSNCTGVVARPQTYQEREAIFSFEVKGGGDCVQILADTGPGDLLDLTFAGGGTLIGSLPSPSSNHDFRVCAAETTSFAFAIRARLARPFTAAAIVCPRTAEDY